MEKREKVLIITSASVRSVDSTIACLESMDQPYVRINTDEIISKEGKISLWCLEDQGVSITVGNDNMVLSRIKSIWHRRPSSPKAIGYEDETQKVFIQDEFSATLWSMYTSFKEVFWMNDPLSSSKRVEHNKFLQTTVAKSCGLKVPDTIITNDAEEAIRFLERNGGMVVAKMIKSRIFEKGDGSATGIYTNVVTTEQIVEGAESLSCAPVMFQSYVPKRIELRVTVVGDQVLSCAIHSQDSEKTKHDWRHYDFENVKHEPHTLPDEIHQKLLCFMRKLNLEFGAIDMVLTPEGEYFFLEVNPSGQFGWIEHLTGLKISEAIAKTLAFPPR